MGLEITERKLREGAHLIALAGRLDVRTESRLRDELSAVLARGELDVIVDLGAVSSLSSGGLGTLLLVHRRLASDGGTLVLVCDEAKHRRLQASGLDRVFQLAGSLEQAIDRLLLPRRTAA